MKKSNQSTIKKNKEYMLDSKNLVNITGGVVVDPEVVNGNILKLRLAVDYAGSEKGGSTSGYFDVTYFLNGDDNVRNAKFVKSQIDAGNIKKGSQLSLVGRLVQERWTTDDKKSSKVVIIAESISYASSGGNKSEEKSASASQSELPDNF